MGFEPRSFTTTPRIIENRSFALRATLPNQALMYGIMHQELVDKSQVKSQRTATDIAA